MLTHSRAWKATAHAAVTAVEIFRFLLRKTQQWSYRQWLHLWGLTTPHFSVLPRRMKSVSKQERWSRTAVLVETAGLTFILNPDHMLFLSSCCRASLKVHYEMSAIDKRQEFPNTQVYYCVKCKEVTAYPVSHHRYPPYFLFNFPEFEAWVACDASNPLEAVLEASEAWPAFEALLARAYGLKFGEKAP